MRRRNWSYLILNAVLIVIILFLFLPNILVLYPFLVGADYSTNHTIGFSMVPVVKPGYTILIKKSRENIQIGDIIVFKEDSSIISHRVMEIQIYPDIMFKTKGDANKGPDGWIKTEQVKGKVVCIIPSAFFVPLKGLIGLMILSVSLIVIIKRRKEPLSSNLTNILLVIIFMYSLGQISGQISSMYICIK